MKVDFAEQHVKGSHGLGPSKAFSIRTTAQAFKLLSSGLYSDKAAAVLREIGCNAMDAHVQAGTPDRPIEVKLPNRIDPQLYIKDWGPGLSDQDVMDMYTTYFASTKQDSNDYTGAFGLGSKSPFSYADSFTVTSVHGGKKRTYSAHLDNRGAPTIARLTEEDADADWDHGLMVAFPVKPTDFNTFQDRANSIYRWFRVTPLVRGGARPSKVEFTLETPEFFRVSDAVTGVLMGNVYYPLTPAQLPGLTAIARSMFDIGHVVLKVDIGDVNVAASRESLQYDKQTIAFLVKRCEAVGKYIANDIAAQIRRTMNAAWDEKCKLKDLKTGWAMDRWFNWNSYFSTTGMADHENLANVLTNRHQELPKTVGLGALVRIIRPGNSGAAKHSIVTEGIIKRSAFRTERAVLVYDDATKLFYGEAPHALERVRQEVVQGRVKQALMITKHPTKGAPKDVQAEVDEILRSFPGLPSAKVDTLPVPPARAAGTKKASSKVAATLPLPPTIIRVIDAENRPAQRAMNTLKPEDQHYMCRTPSWEWGDYADSAVRFYEKTYEEDRAMSRRSWNTLWTSFVQLQEELGAKVSQNYAILTAAEIKSADVVKRGWKWTYSVIEAWLQDPATQAKVVAAASKWRPTIELSYHQRGGWLRMLAHVYQTKPGSWKLLKPALASSAIPGLDDTVEQLVATSKAAGKRAGQNQPPAITLFETLNRAMDLKIMLTMPATGRQFTTPEQLNELISSKLPMTDKIDPDTFDAMMEYPDAAKVAAFGQLLFN